MARARYLADTSTFAQLSKPPVLAAVAPLIAQCVIALCAPVMFELGFSARNRADFRSLMDRLDAFAFMPVTDGDHRRALEVQSLLVERGQHRSLSLVDGLVAAVAETRQLAVLHYDADFELVATLTGQAHQWVVPPGTAD